MLHTQDKIPEFNPVVAGRTAAVHIPVGPTYRELILRYKTNGADATAAEMAADIENIKLKIDGTSYWDISGADLLALNKYYGYGYDDGELPLALARPWARTVVGEENLAWGTRNVSNFVMEVKLAAGAVAPELFLDASTTRQSRDLGSIVEIRTYPYDFSGGGKKEIADLPRGNGAFLAAHLSSEYITAVEAKLNKTPVVENDISLKAYQNSLKRVAGRVPQANYTHIDAMAINRLEDIWPLKDLTDFRVNPTLSQADQVLVIMETVNEPKGAAKPA